MKRINRMLIGILVLELIAGIFSLAKAEITSVWCVCQPGSEVNIRRSPSYKAQIIGMAFPGDEIRTDGKRRGAWLHVVDISCEYSDGWIHRGYLVDEEPELVDADFEVSSKTANARRYVGGKIRRRLKRGDTVKVFYLSGEYAVTDQGTMMVKYLAQIGGY